MITAVVSGSFKFKPEIDATITTLEETGIQVLEPTKGWLILPSLELTERLRYGQVRPLPTEENLSTKEIEERFLKALGKASFMYLMNPGGYVGLSASLEIGFALAGEKPIYALESLDYDALEIDDLSWRETLTKVITVLPPKMVAAHFTQNLS